MPVADPGAGAGTTASKTCAGSVWGRKQRAGPGICPQRRAIGQQQVRPVQRHARVGLAAHRPARGPGVAGRGRRRPPVAGLRGARIARSTVPKIGHLRTRSPHKEGLPPPADDAARQDGCPGNSAHQPPAASSTRSRGPATGSGASPDAGGSGPGCAARRRTDPRGCGRGRWSAYARSRCRPRPRTGSNTRRSDTDAAPRYRCCNSHAAPA